VGVSCQDSTTGVDNSQSATFQGKVEQNNNSPQQVAGQSREAAAPAVTQSADSLQGTVVTAAVVKANGDLAMVGDNQVKTDADGTYTLKVDLSEVSDASNRIIIMAKSGDQTAKTFVASNVQNGETITVQPITLKSSAEADVFQQVVANGDTSEVSKADIEVAVQANIAAEIKDNTEAAANLAEALAIAAKAKTDFYAQNGMEITNDQQQQIMKAKQQAAIKLASDLNAASSTEAKQNAADSFLKSVASAELDAGVRAGALAKWDNIAAHVLLKNSAFLSSDAQNEIRKYAYFYTAVAVNAAAKADAKAAGASDNTVNAIANAGADLQSAIIGTTDASAKVINEAFLRYNEDVKTAVRNDSSLNGSAFAAANTEINASDGAKSTMETKIKGAGSLSDLLGIYSDYSSSIKAIVKTNFSNASKDQVKAYTQLLVLINLAS
jgi:rRNA maturation endonuclease Nob1